MGMPRHMREISGFYTLTDASMLPTTGGLAKGRIFFLADFTYGPAIAGYFQYPESRLRGSGTRANRTCGSMLIADTAYNMLTTQYHRNRMQRTITTTLKE
jgi:hypothetical protein